MEQRLPRQVPAFAGMTKGAEIHPLAVVAVFSTDAESRRGAVVPSAFPGLTRDPAFFAF